MKHVYTEYNSEFKVDVKCESTPEVDEHGALRLNRIELLHSVYLDGGAEKFAVLKLNQRASQHWLPVEMTLHQSCALVQFDNGRHVAIPLHNIRWAEALCVVKRDERVLNLAKARAAKAAKKESNTED